TRVSWVKTWWAQRGAPGWGLPPPDRCLLRDAEAQTHSLVARYEWRSGLRVSVVRGGNPQLRPVPGLSPRFLAVLARRREAGRSSGPRSDDGSRLPARASAGTPAVPGG